MNILLVYPKMPSTFWTFDHAVELAGKQACYPPLGLLTVAAMLPKEWNKRLIDLNVTDLEVGDDLGVELSDEVLQWADFVFVGAMNVQVRSTRAVIARCNAAGVKVVAGGPLFTHEHETFDNVDHFILNEAEITLPLFLADLEAGNPKPLYATPEFANVHETPIPLWELADLDKYVFAIVQYSRGCPYMCDFCDVTALFGRKPRIKTPDQMLAELRALGDLGRFDMVLFADDNLIGNQVHLKKELLPALIDWRAQAPFRVNFGTQVTVNLVDDPVLTRMMLEAGFGSIFCGLESPDEETLKASKKRQNTKRDLVGNVQRLHELGFTISAGFIVGFDTDTPASFQRMIDFIQESGIVIATVNLLKAPPGTDLHARIKREGRLIEPFNFDENESNIVPVMDPRTLHEGFDYVLSHVYRPSLVYKRARTFLTPYETSKPQMPRRKYKGSVIPKRRDFAALGRILYHIGIAGKARAEFWKYVGWTVLHRPAKIRMALMLATMAYQLEKMYERYDAAAEARKMEIALVEMPVPVVSTPAEAGVGAAKSA
jgi:radical SAM superfamily enzyme YgiQ (UPF0313 family)